MSGWAHRSIHWSIYHVVQSLTVAYYGNAIIKLVASTHPEKVNELETVVADATTFVMNQLLAEVTLDTEEEDPVFCLRSVELLDIPM